MIEVKSEGPRERSASRNNTRQFDANRIPPGGRNDLRGIHTRFCFKVCLFTSWSGLCTCHVWSNETQIVITHDKSTRLSLISSIQNKQQMKTKMYICSSIVFLCCLISSAYIKVTQTAFLMCVCVWVCLQIGTVGSTIRSWGMTMTRCPAWRVRERRTEPLPGDAAVDGDEEEDEAEELAEVVTFIYHWLDKHVVQA